MSEDERKKIQDAQTHVEEMHKSGRLGDDPYRKCQIALAYEWMILGDTTEVRLLLQAIPFSYYEKVMPQQMSEDPQFLAVAYDLALRLVAAGVADAGPKLVYTQAPASA